MKGFWVLQKRICLLVFSSFYRPFTFLSLRSFTSSQLTRARPDFPHISLLGSDASASLRSTEPFIGWFCVVETVKNNIRKERFIMVQGFRGFRFCRWLGEHGRIECLHHNEPESREKRKLTVRWLYCFSFFFTSGPWNHATSSA